MDVCIVFIWVRDHSYWSTHTVYHTLCVVLFGKAVNAHSDRGNLFSGYQFSLTLRSEQSQSNLRKFTIALTESSWTLPFWHGCHFLLSSFTKIVSLFSNPVITVTFTVRHEKQNMQFRPSCGGDCLIRGGPLFFPLFLLFRMTMAETVSRWPAAECRGSRQ